MGKIKLTKTALNNIIQWTSTQYNDWLGYGTKKQNVELALGILEERKIILEIQCASPAGENPHRGSKKYWKTKQSGGKYLIDGPAKSITNLYSNETIYFL